MPSDKKLSDLEYNVFKSGIDDDRDNSVNKMNMGCMTLVCGIIVTILIVVVIAGFMQIGRNGPAPHCAEPGCSRSVKPGSNYCWLHSASSTKHSGGKSNGSSDGGSSGSGNVIGGGSSDKKTNGKYDSYDGSGSIYGGGSDNTSKDSSRSSSAAAAQARQQEQRAAQVR